jgi:type IV secretory pathway component VirB8
MCTITCGLNIKTLINQNKPLIIGIDSNGTRIVTEQTDPIYKTEAIQFIQKFLFNLYNFTSNNFFKRIGLTTSYMSEELWKRKKNDILSLKEKVEHEEIVLSSEVLKLSRDEKGTYHALISINEKSRLNEQTHKIEVTLELLQTARSIDNPFGLEVNSYEETILRD